MEIYFYFFLLYRNGQNCEGADHRTVVDLIRQGENELTMEIISVTPSEARKLDGPTNMYGSSDYIDYSDRRSIPVSVPDFKHEEKNGDKYVVRYFYFTDFQKKSFVVLFIYVHLSDSVVFGQFSQTLFCSF